MQCADELIHTEERDGFIIDLWCQPEEDDPRGHFASGDDAADQETIDNIESGRWAWFMATVTASKAGVVLGTDYLGGCCYESCQAFVTEDGYYPDMVAAAIDQARAKLAEICA